MSLALPENGRMRICKDPDHCALIVSTNMHDFLGSGETTTEVSFALRDGVFQSEGQMLHEFLEDGESACGGCSGQGGERGAADAPWQQRRRGVA
jgi:hypothetical protein